MYIVDNRNKSGVLLTANKEKIKLKIGDYITVKVQSLGSKEGYTLYENVLVDAVRGYTSRMSKMMYSGGKLCIKLPSCIIGFSGNCILDIRKH